MKDFYKILGVKKDASEEEIRERWIELIKRYHPDRMEDGPSDERIKEINEAYQVLKHSSTRVEYDLRKTYGQEERESRKGSYSRKFGVPAGVLIVVIMIGVIYIRNHQSPTPFGPIASNKIDSNVKTRPLKDPIDSTPQSPMEMIDPTTRQHQDALDTKIPKPNNSTEVNAPITQKPLSPSTLQLTQRPKYSTNQRPKGPTDAKAQQRMDVPVQQPKVAAVISAVPVVPNQGNQPDQRNQIGSSAQRPKDIMSPVTPSIAMAGATEKVQSPQPPQNPITPLPNDVVANKPTPSINEIDQRNQANQKNLNIELAEFKPPSLLATEDEVNKFFSNYVEHYNRMDIESFLSLFSSKGMQNQKEGLERIRKIYTDFFNQGQGIRYHLQDMRIEIYQSAVEVKAHYEIEQIMKKSAGRKIWRGPIRWVLIKEDAALKIASVDYQYQKTP